MYKVKWKEFEFSYKNDCIYKTQYFHHKAAADQMRQNLQHDGIDARVEAVQ